MSDQFRVVTNPANGRARTIFEGIEADARQFLQEKFPRVHVEPGGDVPVPDALLIPPNGSKATGKCSHWAGPETGWVDGPGEEAEAAEAPVAPDLSVPKPADNADTALWRQYAMSRAPHGDVEAINWIMAPERTNADLIAEYGKEA